MAPPSGNLADQKKKRRRRKKARTEDFSSDSSSSSSDEEQQQQPQQQHDNVEDEPEDMDIDLDINVDQKDKQAASQEHPRELIPEPLKNVNSTNESDEKFQDYYIQLMTTQFSDDLDKLRQSKDFGEKSLPNLIKALKEGSHLFNQEERDLIQQK